MHVRRIYALPVAAALSLVPLAFHAPSSRAVAAPRRPNILLIETDDQTLESIRVMQTVQSRLVARGTSFTRAYASRPLCCPSRATVLTGQYAHNSGLWNNTLPNGSFYGLRHQNNTLPVWLHRAGYHTALLGKYLNGYGTRDPRQVPPGWDDWHGSVDWSTYHYRDFTLNDNGTPHEYVGRYQPDVYGRIGATIVRRSAALARPFFFWLAFAAPHFGKPPDPDDPALPTPNVADRYRDSFAGEPLHSGPSFNEADVSDKPRFISAIPRFDAAKQAAIQEAYQQQLETLQSVDDAVGRVLSALDASGEARNTLVVFTSDNAYFYGQHRLDQGKDLPYEPATRVPLIMRGPHVPSGVRRNQLVANVDLAPTFLDAANASPGRLMDGRSLIPLANHAALARSRPILLEAKGRAGQVHGLGRPRLRSWFGVRTPRYVYTSYTYADPALPRDFELYDMRQDPNQLVNRVDEPALAGVRARLAGTLAALMSCSGATCRNP